MRLGGNTVLVTGGATGIGYAMASAFVAAGSEVIICGRREDRLELARAARPALHTWRCADGAVERDWLMRHSWLARQPSVYAPL